MIETLRICFSIYIYNISSSLSFLSWWGGVGVGRLFPGGGSSAVSILLGYFLSLSTWLLKIK